MVANGFHERKKRAAVAKWRASGLSQAEFCRRECELANYFSDFLANYFSRFG
jgi:hypothetical protein